jgi:3-hydroxyisobutyrate dehydrogenase-like beta-hydroxyacid dehydrogenase
MQAEAEGLGTSLPVVSAAIQAYTQAIDAGLEDADSIEQCLFWKTKVRD